MTDRMIIGRIFPVRRRVKRAIINGRLVYIIELPEEFNHIWRELCENNKEVVFFLVEGSDDESTKVSNLHNK